jgi:transient receptor potential cation channel subfamily C protein 4
MYSPLCRTIAARHVVTFAVSLFIAGFVWSECKQLWEEGLKAYVRQWWNWLDFIMLSLYLCTFSLRLVAFAQSFFPERYGPSTLPRTLWPDFDPTIVSEGVFAVANVFSFFRIIYLFQVSCHSCCFVFCALFGGLV